MKQHILAAVPLDALATAARFLLASSVLIAALVVPSNADTITYSYSATNGKAGTLTFEDSVSFTLNSALLTSPSGEHSTRENFYVSEYASYSGTFGEYSFTGLARLRVKDWIGPDYWEAHDLGQTDFWYLSGNVSSTVVDGRTLTYFGVFEDYRPEVEPGNLFVPQPLNQDRQDFNNKFFYYAEYSDGTDESAVLQSLILVPETSPLLLLSCGLLGLGLVRRRYQKPV